VLQPGGAKPSVRDVAMRLAEEGRQAVASSPYAPPLSDEEALVAGGGTPDVEMTEAG
jgi:dienelactone hydrolase